MFPPQGPEMKTTISNSSRPSPPLEPVLAHLNPFSPAVDTLGSSAAGDDHILDEGGK